MMRRFGVLAAFLFAVVTLGMTASCRPTELSSELKLANGKTIPETEHPAVVWIGNCTATFVSDTTLITAAHCIGRDRNGYRPIEISKRINARSLKVYRNPRYTGGIGQHDMAIAIFPPGTAPATIPLQTKTPQVGDEVLFIGYGGYKVEYSNYRSRPIGIGTKRMGVNTIRSLSDGVVHSRRRSTDPESGKDVSVINGDSGGPLLHDGKLLGVASYQSNFTASGHANVQNNSNREFMKSVVAQGAVIPGWDGQDTGGNSQDSQLKLALGSQIVNGSSYLYVSAPNTLTQAGLASVRVCVNVSSAQNCTASNSSTMNARQQKGDVTLFATQQMLAPNASSTYTAVAVDSRGNALTSISFKFQPNTGS